MFLMKNLPPNELKKQYDEWQERVLSNMKKSGDFEEL